MVETEKDSGIDIKRVWYFFKNDGQTEALIYGGYLADFVGFEAGCEKVISGIKYKTKEFTGCEKYSFDYPAIFKAERDFSSGLNATVITTNCPIVSSHAYPVTFTIRQVRDVDHVESMDEFAKNTAAGYKKSKYKNIVVSDMKVGDLPAKQVKGYDEHTYTTNMRVCIQIRRTFFGSTSIYGTSIKKCLPR